MPIEGEGAKTRDLFIISYDYLLHTPNPWILPGLPRHTLTELLGILQIPFILEVLTHATPRGKES